MIAGFKESGIPMLLGDVLLTGKNGSKGVRKKIHKISPNLVVSWTGHLFAAQLVIKDLHQFYQGRKISKLELEDFFKYYQVSDLASLEVQIIGWVIDIVPYCFRWNSGWPHELFYHPFHYGGSGSELLEQANIGSEIGSSPSGEPDLPCGKRRVTDLIGHLLAEEALGHDLQQYGFGHAYDFLYYSGTEFCYMPQTLVSIIQFDMDGNGMISRISLNNTCYKIQSIANETVVQIHSTNDHTTHIEIISNLWTKNPEQLPEIRDYLKGLQQNVTLNSGYKFSYDSDYYSFILHFFETDSSRCLPNFPLIPMSFEKGASGDYFTIEESDNIVSFSFRSDFKKFLEDAYNDIRAEIKSQI